MKIDSINTIDRILEVFSRKGAVTAGSGRDSDGTITDATLVDKPEKTEFDCRVITENKAGE